MALLSFVLYIFDTLSRMVQLKLNIFTQFSTYQTSYKKGNDVPLFGTNNKEKLDFAVSCRREVDICLLQIKSKLLSKVLWNFYPKTICLVSNNKTAHILKVSTTGSTIVQRYSNAMHKLTCIQNYSECVEMRKYMKFNTKITIFDGSILCISMLYISFLIYAKYYLNRMKWTEAKRYCGANNQTNEDDESILCCFVFWAHTNSA